WRTQLRCRGRALHRQEPSPLFESSFAGRTTAGQTRGFLNIEIFEKATRSKFAHSLTNHPANELLCRVFSPSRRPQLNCFDPGWRHPVARGFRSDRSPARMWDMAAIENAKVTIVGAGSVGSATAYATLIRGAARDVVLYDIDAARVEAEALDLAHGAMFTGSSSIVGSADIAATAGSNVIVVTAGAAQRPG